MYVMLTRCKSLDGLLLLRLPSRSAFEAGPPQYVKDEMERLARLHSSTMQHFYQNLSKLLPTMPAKVAALFASSDMNADNTDWPSLATLLKEEILQKEKAAGFHRGHRLREKTKPCSVDSPGKPVRGPLKRRSSVLSEPGEPAQRITSPAVMTLDPASKAACSSSVQKSPSVTDATAASVPYSKIPTEKEHRHRNEIDTTIGPADGETASVAPVLRRGPMKRKTASSASDMGASHATAVTVPHSTA
jgi:hypothetical protein